MLTVAHARSDQWFLHFSPHMSHRNPGAGTQRGTVTGVQLCGNFSNSEGINLLGTAFQRGPELYPCLVFPSYLSRLKTTLPVSKLSKCYGCLSQPRQVKPTLHRDALTPIGFFLSGDDNSPHLEVGLHPGRGRGTPGSLAHRQRGARCLISLGTKCT